jgi:hypothetical protein
MNKCGNIFYNITNINMGLYGVFRWGLPTSN